MRFSSADTSSESSLQAKDYLLLGVLLLAAFSIRIYFHQFYRVISADGIGYVSIAQDFITGKGLAKSTHYPPFYPMLVGFASLAFKDFELAGRAVSIVMGSLIVLPVYLLGKDFLSRRAGFLAATLTMSWWSIRSWSGEVMSQATYMTLVLSGVYLVWVAVSRRSPVAAVTGGVCLALAHLTRSEGVLVYFAITAVLLAGIVSGRLPRKSLWYVLASWGAFWLVFSPYFILLHKLNGAWQLTGKSRIAIADGLSMYLNRPDLKMDPHFAAMGYLDLFKQYPEYLRNNIVVNTATCWKQMLPAFLWVISIIGFISSGWNKDAILKKGYLLATFVPLLPIILFFFIGPEYTQPYLPVLFLFASQGVEWVGQKTCGLLGADRANNSRYAALTGAIPVAAVLCYSSYLLIGQVPADRNEPYHYEMDEGRYDDKQVGIRLRSIIPEGSIIMTRSGRIGFYSQRPYVMPTQGTFAEIVADARKDRVSYLVATVQMLNMRPQMEVLYGPLLHPEKEAVSPPGFKLIYTGQEPGGLPYLVYHVQ